MDNLNKDSINELISELKMAAKVYYQGESELMSDEEYDTKCEYLESLIDSGELEITDELSQLLYDSVAAGTTPAGTVVLHDYPMLSLGKAKDDEELLKYHERLNKAGAKGYKLEMKFDGLALSAKYGLGKLTQLATRGDGVKGELLNHLINHKQVKIVGLPSKVDYNDDFEVRGELYISDIQFKEINKSRIAATGEAFSNSRNAATGIVKRSQREMEYCVELTFTAYSAYLDGEQVDFDTLGDVELITAKDVTEKEIARLSTDELSLNCEINSHEFEDLKKAVDTFGILRKQFQVPTDGVVIKPLNELEMLSKLGYTSRHPIANIAYKYPGEKATTKVLDIIVSVGKTGKLTPQAILEPVEVGGVMISNVTCHNYSWIKTMDIRIGSTVAVTRANDVIPAIDVVINKGPNEPIEVPTNCPECGNKLIGDGTDLPKTLTCENLSCSSRILYHLRSAVGRDYLYLEGLGDIALKALVDNGLVENIVDIFKLSEEDLANVPTGFTSIGNVRLLGAGNAVNIMKSIDRAKNNTDSNKLLAALNIEGMGPSTAKRLISHFGGIVKVLSVDVDRLTEVNQVGETLVDSFKLHQTRALSQLNELIKLGFKINDPIKKNSEAFKGTFSVSGSVEGFSNRSEFVKHMEDLGWEFHKSPKKSTDVIFADPSGTSSKLQKARENGTRIINNLKDL